MAQPGPSTELDGLDGLVQTSTEEQVEREVTLCLESKIFILFRC